MKKMIKMFLVIFLLIFFGSLLFVLFFYDSSLKDEILFEEAIPIREGEIITGMNYLIKISKKEHDETIILKPSILESINHYKDMNTINDFSIHLEIDNESDYPYLLKNISIVDERDNSLIKDINSYQKNSNNKISFELNKDIFQNYKNYHKIKIELER